MKKTWLAAVLAIVSYFGQSQTCVQLVYPANNQTVQLVYDAVQSISTSNGVELKWRQVPGSLYYVYYGPQSGGYNPLETFPFGPGYSWTSDTSVIIPMGYNESYHWFVSTEEVNPVVPCTPADSYSFTTASPPPFCKPGCTNVLNTDFFAFYTVIPGSNNSDDYYSGFACQQYNPAGSKVPELMTGKSYVASFWNELNYGPYSLWIDFNDNGYFETGERLVSNLIFPNDGTGNFSDFNDRLNPANAVLYVPETAAIGTHRIRIISTGGDDPCAAAASMMDGFIKIIASDNIGYGLTEIANKNTCVPVTNVSVDSKSNNNNQWMPLVDRDNHIVASINANGNNLGIVSVIGYENEGPIRTLPNGTKVMDRSIEIKPEFQPATPVDVRLYFSKAEFDALKAADNTITDISSINISKFASGCGQPPSGYSYLSQTGSGIIDSFYYVQFSTSSFSDFFLRGGSDDLPVSFVSLDAKRIGSNAIISWQTATEANCKGFEVEYSSDGIGFSSITFVASHAAGGNSNSLLYYSYNHIGVSSYVGYYRIKQIDKDGSISYSAVVLVSFNKDKFSVLISPNPGKGRFSIQLFNWNSSNGSLRIADMNGRTVYQRASIGRNVSTLPIDIQNLPKGLYMVTIEGEGQKIVQKLVIE